MGTTDRPRLLSSFLLCIVIGYSALVDAVEEKSAHEVMGSTTDRIMTILAEAAEYQETEPQRFYEEIHAVLDEVVDFEGFARGVMGKYASKSRYVAMSDEEKMHFREQVGRFSDVMRLGLVRTYGKGLLAFNGSRVVILPPEESGTGNSKSATVVQHIFGSGDKPYVIHYSMRQNRDGDWRLRNLIVESINLGQIYRNQFESAMRDHRGDINVVIDNWDVSTTESVGENVEEATSGKQS